MVHTPASCECVSRLDSIRRGSKSPMQMQRRWQSRVVVCACVQVVVLGHIVAANGWTSHTDLKPANHGHGLGPQEVQQQQCHRKLKVGVNLTDDVVHRRRLAVASEDLPKYAYLTDSEGVYRKKVLGWREAAYAEGVPNPMGFTGNSLAIPVVQGRGLYRAEIHVGSPAQKLLLELDTGSDLTWIKCRPGVACQQGEFGNDVLFDPQRSSTFGNYFSESLLDQGDEGRTFAVQCTHDDEKSAPVCRFLQKYADGSYAGGGLVMDSISIPDMGDAKVATSSLVLGCESSSFGDFETGLLGLGRGRLSLPSQIGELYGHKFAYCLSTAEHYNSSFLRFGESATPGVPGMKYLSLIQNPKRPSLYYLRLEGLSVGQRQLQLSADDFSIDARTGAGGVVLDSGTTYTFLPPVVYRKLTEAFEKKMTLPRASSSTKLHLCFSVVGKNMPWLLVPTVTLHFREGERLVDIELPAENVLKQVTPTKVCLAALPNHGPAGGPAVIGNMWQRNFHILIDSLNNSVGFLGPKVCNMDGYHRYDLAEAWKGHFRDPYALAFAIALFVPASFLSSLLISLILKGYSLQCFGRFRV
ncbi:hypothetical protein MPTK1_5g08070 [Marchantia polymorpha subsp. ruderalis]|uniref:Peptidase A1 domain-containing protein n=2 Tax=Marchantia polymorpha TaxID=3197 RepID=A0AAF6BG41_MARPO|nr:hypothetical protein Mp_5g08070 [Marchantia polymorpha subsp. ruderalis]